MGKSASDNELLQASLAGSRDAFGVIVQRYQALVCAVTYSATGDIAKSEELAQQTFVNAWKNLWQLKDLGKFRAWLCTIARDLVSQSAKGKSRDIVGQAVRLARAEAVATDMPDPSQAAIAKERQEIVWSALREAPERYREPMVLFYRRQRSVSEVAADLGLSEDTVRQRLHRGRQLIKAEVSSLVEDTLGRSGPGKAFTVAVVAALPAVAAQTAGAAVAGVVAQSAEGVPAAKAVIASGLSGAVLGPILGLLGGIVGAWCSIRNTRSPRERRFVIRMIVLLWLLLCGLIGAPLVLMFTGIVPGWFYWTCFTVFFCTLMPLIVWGNRRQRQIQVEDGTFVAPPDVRAGLTKPTMYASFGGAMFGSILWLVILAGIAHDWATMVAVLGAAAVLLPVTVRIAGRPGRYWTGVYVAHAGIATLTFTAVNLRWQRWMHIYRLSTAYNSLNDVSLATINLIVAAAFLLALVMLTLTTRQRRRHPPAKA